MHIIGITSQKTSALMNVKGIKEKQKKCQTKKKELSEHQQRTSM